MGIGKRNSSEKKIQFREEINKNDFFPLFYVESHPE